MRNERQSSRTKNPKRFLFDRVWLFLQRESREFRAINPMKTEEPSPEKMFLEVLNRIAANLERIADSLENLPETLHEINAPLSDLSANFERYAREAQPNGDYLLT